MAEYGKVYKKVWRQGRFRSMSERARLLLIYLWCGPHANSIGLYVLPPEYLASDFQWSIDELSDHFRNGFINSSETVTETVRQTVSKPFDELLRNGWVQYDAQSNVILIDSWYNGEPKATHTIQNQNQLKRALVDVSELPRTQLVSVLIEQASATDSGVPERYLKPFVEQLRERLPKPLGKQLPKQFRNGLRECEINSKEPFRNIEAVAEAEAEAEDETVAVANAAVSTPDQEVKDPPPGAHPRERRDVQRIFEHLQMQVGNWNVCIAGSRPWHWIERIIDRFGDDRVLLVADKIAQFYAERGKIPPATTDKARQKLWEWLEREELGEQRQSRSHDALISDLTKGRG